MGAATGPKASPRLEDPVSADRAAGWTCFPDAGGLQDVNGVWCFTSAEQIARAAGSPDLRRGTGPELAGARRVNLFGLAPGPDHAIAI
jgi:hypothetical protein